MSAYFQNTILPGAKPADVCEAICRWHAAEGYEQETGRLLFDCQDLAHEKRLFVLWNDKSCVVLQNNGVEDAAKLRGALGDFPLVLQLWARDGGWGYRLEKVGRLTASHSSKPGLAAPDENRVESPNALAGFTAACGVPRAVDRLRRIERARYFFNQKPCAEFADALNAPVAILSFHELDQANAGIAEEESALDWKCRVLAFKKSSEQPATQSARGPSMTLSNEDRAEVARIHARMQKFKKWTRWLRAPFFLLVALFTIPFIAMMVAAAYAGRIPQVRRLCLGRGTVFCDQFLKQIKAAEPKRIQIQGVSVINTRHQCSIVTANSVKALPEFLPRKGFLADEPVFDMKFADNGFSCTAYPPGRAPIWRGVDILETRSFSTANGNVAFEKRRTRTGKRRWLQYEWTMHSRRAVYRFFCSSEPEFTEEQIETLESVVRSFRTSDALT